MDAHKNLAITAVSVAPSPAASGTSLTVADSSVFPAAPFNATVWPTGTSPLPATSEIVRVTNIAGNVLTITRTQEGTSARTILVGDLIANTITVKVLTDIEDALSAETADRISADNALSNQVSVLSAGLSNEASARAAADTSLAQAISVVSNAVSVVSAAVVVVSALATTANAHADTVSNAVSILSAKLSTEISAISQAHSALSAAHVSAVDRLSALSDAHTSLVNRVSANSATGGGGSVTSQELSLTSAHFHSVTSAISGRLASVMSLLDGGTTGQVLKKQSNTDFDFAWDTDATGGSTSGTVTSAALVSINNRISGVSAAVSALSADLTSVKDRVSANSSLISTVASALSARIDTVSNAVSVLSATLSTQISAISQAHSALSAAHVSLVDRVSANSSLISTVASALSARIDTVSNAVSVLSATLSTQISAISQAHSALSAAHVSLVDRVSANSGLISTVASALSVRIDTVSQQVSVLSATGHIISLQNNDASVVSAGTPVYAFTSANTFKKANAGNATTKHVIGLVLDGSVAISTVGRVQTGGPVTLTTGQWDAITGQAGGLTIGSVYYLDTTAGLLTATPPATGALRPVGIALSTTVMQLMLADVDDLTSAVSTLSTAISALSVQLSLQVSALSQVHSALSAAHVSLVDRVSGISAAVSSLSADLTSVKDRVSANSSLISTTASALSARIDTVSNAVSVLSATLSTQISAISQAHSVLSAAHVSLVDRVSANSATGGGGSVTSAEYLSLVNRVSANSAVAAGSGGFVSATNNWSVAVSAGAPVYWDTASATFKLASAGHTPAGFVTNGSVASAAVGTVQTRDVLALTTAQWDAITGQSGGLTVGAVYYVGTTAGTLTPTLPSASARAVGVAVSTTEMQVRISEVGDWLSDAISVGTATAADLSNKISALSALISTQVSALSTALSTETSARIAGDSALSTLISALSAELSLRISAMSQVHSALSVRVDTISNQVSIISSGLGGLQLARVQTNQSISGTTPLAISGLSISVAAAGIYQVEGMMMHSMSGVSVFGFALSLSGATPANCTYRWLGNLSVGTGVSALSTTVMAAGWSNDAGFGSVTYSVLATNAANLGTKLDGIIGISTTGGTLVVLCKAGVSGCITIKAGSYLRAYKLV